MDAPQGTAEQPSEEELRAAYEAELNRISSVNMILQTTVSLINIGGRRLGMTAPGSPPAEAERDLEQVRDAIDGARALMPILERHMAAELGPMRDAISQLQMAYAREVQAAPAAAPPSSARPRRLLGAPRRSARAVARSGAPEGGPRPRPGERPTVGAWALGGWSLWLLVWGALRARGVCGAVGVVCSVGLPYARAGGLWGGVVTP